MRAKSSQPILVDLLVNDKMLAMELDTGAAVSIISEQLQKQVFPEAKLRKATILLKNIHWWNTCLFGMKWKWSQQCTQAFQVHYDPSLPVTLARDASAYGLGAVIITPKWKKKHSP